MRTASRVPSAARRRVALAASGLLFALGTAAGALWASLPDVSALHAYAPSLPSVIVDRAGRPIGEFGAERRKLIALAGLPPVLVDAFLSAEDERFWAHDGVDASAVLRALIANLRGGHIVQGGSTITQQLAKSLYLENERTLSRKVREATFALAIERQLDKESILELYLNQIYLGSGAYGVAVAAETYFGRPVEELGLAEAALLAGLPKAPSALSPFVDPGAAEERRRWVLGRMLALGRIDPAAHDAARAAPPRIARAPPPEGFTASAYFVEQIRQALVERLGAETVLRGGLRVETPLDLDLQRRAHRALRAGVDASLRRAGRGGRPGIQGALVALDVESGEVRAWVGGYDFAESRFDRVCQARRQPGSAFKTFAYGAALERGFQLDTPVYDVQFEARNTRLPGSWWRPRNDGRAFRGALPLSEAFARSLNNASLRLASDLGPRAIVDFARRAGISSPLPDDLGIVLGTAEVTPLELTNAYATFARGGRYTAPRFVRRVLDRRGSVLLDELPLCNARPPPAAAGISAVDAYLVTHLLGETVRPWYGTGHAAARLGPALAGKTGSTNENRDAWFVGYTPALAAGVWVGRDDHTPLGRAESGARAALPIWIDFMEAVRADAERLRFPRPEGVLFASTDAESGARVVTSQAVPGWTPVASGRRTRLATVAELPPTETLLGLGAAALPAVAAPPPAADAP